MLKMKKNNRNQIPAELVDVEHQVPLGSSEAE